MMLIVTSKRSLRPRSRVCDYSENTPPWTPRSKAEPIDHWPEPLIEIKLWAEDVKDVYKPVLIDDLVIGSTAMKLDPTGKIRPEEAYTESKPFMDRMRGMRGEIPLWMDIVDTIRDDTILRDVMWSRFGLKCSVQKDMKNFLYHVKGFARCWREFAHCSAQIRPTTINHTTKLGLWLFLEVMMAELEVHGLRERRSEAETASRPWSDAERFAVQAKRRSL